MWLFYLSILYFECVICCAAEQILVESKQTLLKVKANHITDFPDTGQEHSDLGIISMEIFITACLCSMNGVYVFMGICLLTDGIIPSPSHSSSTFTGPMSFLGGLPHPPISIP